MNKYRLPANGGAAGGSVDVRSIDNTAVLTSQTDRLNTMKAHRDETLVANALRALTESAQTKADAAFKDQSSNLLALAVDAARVRL